MKRHTTVRGLGNAAGHAFARATDLGTGLEHPVPIERGALPGEIRVRATACAPRTFLRVYWAPDRS